MTMDITYNVTFEHKDHGHGTSVHCGTLEEVMDTIEKMKPEYECTHLEVIWDVTKLMKDKRCH